jgi:predicted  nucleic acid-binding Zn-ribbon protein
MSDVIREAYDKLVAEKKEITDKSYPLREEREGIITRVRAVEAELKKIDDEIASIEKPRLFDLDNEIAALARMLPNHVKAPVVLDQPDLK